MKKLIRLSAAVVALAFATASCVSETTEFDPGKETPAEKEVGYLSFETAALNVVTDEEILPTTQARTASAPDVGSFEVDILDGTQTSVLSFPYGEKPADPVELPVGNYTLDVRSGTVPDAGWETPLYTAAREFSIVRGQTTSLGEIACRLANIKATVTYADDLKAELEEGTHTDITVAGHTLSFLLDEARAGYFRAGAASNPMEVTIHLVVDGKTKKLTTTIEDTKAGQWRKITVRKEYSNLGTASLSLTVETVTQNEVISTDVTTLLDEEILSDDDPLSPTVVWQGQDIDRRYQLLKSMFDQNGSYIPDLQIEIGSPQSTIARLRIDITSTSAEFMASLTAMNFLPSFDLCGVTASDTPALHTALTLAGIPTGGRVQGQRSVIFDLQGVMGLLYAFDGEHDFRMTVVDGDRRSTIKTLSLLVDKNGETGTGTEGPTIVWVDYDIDRTYEVTADLPVKIDVKAEEGIAGFVVDIDSDVLTSDILGMIGLQSHIDLIEPGEMEVILSTPYPDGLGFPVRDQVRNQTYVPFDITNFMSMILDLGMPGYFNFHLTVTDNQGNSTTRTVKLTVSEN